MNPVLGFVTSLQIQKLHFERFRVFLKKQNNKYDSHRQVIFFNELYFVYLVFLQFYSVFNFNSRCLFKMFSAVRQ